MRVVVREIWTLFALFASRGLVFLSVKLCNLSFLYWWNNVSGNTTSNSTLFLILEVLAFSRQQGEDVHGVACFVLRAVHKAIARNSYQSTINKTIDRARWKPEATVCSWRESVWTLMRVGKRNLAKLCAATKTHVWTFLHIKLKKSASGTVKIAEKTDKHGKNYLKGEKTREKNIKVMSFFVVVVTHNPAKCVFLLSKTETLKFESANFWLLLQLLFEAFCSRQWVSTGSLSDLLFG